MNRIFLYAHGGSKNHGCEAIVRSTAKIFESNNIYLISSSPEEDYLYDIDKFCTILKEQNKKINKKSIDFIKAYLDLKINNNYISMDKLWYKETFSKIEKGNIAFSIGGDNYCYADVNKYIMLHDMLKKQNVKTVLWGCSIEPDIVKKKEISEDLAKYDLICARESISYTAIKEVNPNTFLMADPAFLLEQVEADLPKEFDVGNTVGINLSPMVIEQESVPGIAIENYKNLISYIMKNTDMHVALIPHVIWKGGDDRIPLKQLYDEFSNSDRICLIEDCGCCELKNIISKCKFFVGARTHSTIAAYSTGVPTIVLGYSVKSKGIAKDIFGSENNYVVPVQTLKSKMCLVDEFKQMVAEEKKIHDLLEKYLMSAKLKIENIKKIVKILEE